MKVLITGGSGFIGTHLILDLLKSGIFESIKNLDIVDAKIKDTKLETDIVDIRDSKLNNKVNGIFDICIHLAALCKEPGFKWEEYFETNHVGTVNTISLCEKLGIEKIIFTSTMMVYQAGEVQRTENSITTPDTAYGISKLLAEKELQIWKARGINRELKIIRPAVVFGENENANFTRLYKSLKRGLFPFIGKDSTVKSNIYVHELNAFIQFLLTQHTPTDVFNFGFPETYTMRQITDAFNSVFGFKPFRPTLPLGLMLIMARLFQLLNALGFKNPIHPRRIEKLYYSTNILPKAALDSNYQFKYDLKSALEDWKQSVDPNL